MARDPSIRLVIEGHTDVTGAYQRNMMLSWERAYSVFKLLVERYGIDPARLQPIGRGPLEPMPGVAPNDGMNRRVQFRVAG
jgi:outer membrane protein OmpA-like peptidoglycan-associated protein